MEYIFLAIAAIFIIVKAVQLCRACQQMMDDEELT
jgi:hypothetical protein